MTFKEFRQKITSPLLWGNCLGMMIVLIGAFITVWVGLKHYTLHGETIDVPNVKGMTLDESQRILTALGLEATVVDSSYDRSKRPGVILEQIPAGGNQVKQGREILLTLNSKNKPTKPIPEIIDNCSLREAEARLKALGFTLGPVKRVDGEKDWVYGIKCGSRTLMNGDRTLLEEPLTLQVGKGNGEDGMGNLAADSAALDVDIYDFGTSGENAGIDFME